VEVPSEAHRAVVVPNAAGLHARPCHAIASTALGFQSDLEVRCEGRRANGKSILELMTLDASQGKVLELVARGPDSRPLVEALERLVASGFDEPG
jgi:phosphotransferase system HPr (HPr) family protein